jgi:hypothetical protein
MHYPGHIREAFLDWIDEGYPPIARVEVNYEEQAWPARRLMRRMLRCSDVMPSAAYRQVRQDFGLNRMTSQTYAAVARNLIEALPADGPAA